MNLTDVIIKTINSIYSFLDDIVFVDSNILSDLFMQKVFGTNSSNGTTTIPPQKIDMYPYFKERK